VQFVVLSSSRGTTFQAILDRIADGSLTAQFLGLIADNPDRGCIEKAKKAGVPVIIVEPKKDEPREEYDKRLHKAIQSLQSQVASRKSQVASRQSPVASRKSPVIACIGWFRIISPWFIGQWKNQILNVHPSLLPKYPGLHAHEEVLAAKEKESGMTIHIVDEGLDTGPVLMQKTCPVFPNDTPDTLKARVQELEKEWYPKVLEMIEDGKLSLS
jgi:phosphoribosylglycinamide formyltransferase-1